MATTTKTNRLSADETLALSRGPDPAHRESPARRRLTEGFGG